MIKIDLLKNHPNSISELAKIWHELIGKVWAPKLSIEEVIKRFNDHLNENMLPLTLVAFDGSHPIGMCSLRENDGIRPDIAPWLGSLVIDPAYQKQGIGKLLVDAIKDKARELKFKQLYLFALDPDIPAYYGRLGWRSIGIDSFKGHPVTVMEIML